MLYQARSCWKSWLRFLIASATAAGGAVVAGGGASMLDRSRSSTRQLASQRDLTVIAGQGIPESGNVVGERYRTPYNSLVCPESCRLLAGRVNWPGVAAGVGGMVGLRWAIARWRRRGIIDTGHHPRQRWCVHRHWRRRLLSSQMKKTPRTPAATKKKQATARPSSARSTFNSGRAQADRRRPARPRARDGDG